MRIVVLSGKQGSGKTTLQKELIKEYERRKGGTALAMNFADVIYEMHDAILEVLHRNWPARAIAKDGPLLQLLGTEWGRKTIDEKIWVKVLKNRVEQVRASDAYEIDLVIIGDCRFEDEFHAFPEALRVRLVASEDARKKRCSMWRENTSHPSEISLDRYTCQGEFDLHMWTDTNTIDHCVTMILAQLDKNVWLEKRKVKGIIDEHSSNAGL